MSTNATDNPIDDQQLTDRVVAAALEADRRPLLQAKLPDRPGGYLLFAGPGVAVGDELAALGPYVLGERPLYAGAAADLHGRALRYRSVLSLGGAARFPLSRIWVAVVPTRTLAGALLVEGVLIEVFEPPFNLPTLAGLGSRQPGRGRVSTQRVSPWDRLWRRPWAGSASAAEVCATRLALASRVALPHVSTPRWPRLPRAPILS